MVVPLSDDAKQKLVAALVSPPPDPKDPYYAELGRFVTGFARAEMHVRAGLKKLVGMGDREVAALFHKWSLSECMEGINRLLAARDDEITAGRLKEPFAQFQAIAEIRNALVHWETKLESPIGFVVANSHRAHKPDKAVEHRVDQEQLKRMNWDLLLIVAQIAVYMNWDELHSPSFRDSEFFKEVVEPAMRLPWTYIRPQPGR